MNKIFTLLAFAASCSGAFAASTDVNPDKTGMTMSAQEWCKNVSAGWNLGNSLESAGGTWDNTTWTFVNVFRSDANTWETTWGNPEVTENQIKAVKEAGFNAIRIPVRWIGHITDQETMTVDPTWMARVKQVVDWCIDNDLYVIINTHHDYYLESNPIYSKQAQIKKMEKALWTNIATTFRDYDEHLAFAGTNEVTMEWKAPTEENLSVQNGYNQDFVDAVRATGGKNYYRNLIVQTYACDPNYGLGGKLVIPTDVVDDRLSVEFHYYQPYSYCSGKTEGSSYYYWGDAYKSKGSVPSDNEKTLTDLFARVSTSWWEKGYGVVIGEYGVSDHYTGSATEISNIHANMTYYIKTLVSEARKRGFAAFIWDNNAFGNGSEKFGLFDRNNNMTVKCQYFLDGVKSGATTPYGYDKADIAEVETNKVSTTPSGGTTLFNGSKVLGWGNGTSLSADQMKNVKAGDKLVIVTTPNTNSTTHCMQMFDGSWANQLIPQVDITSTSGIYVTTVTLTEELANTMKQKGIVIQGIGLTLKKIMLVSATGIQQICDDNADESVYSLSGTRVKNPTQHGIYIINGKKVFK